MEQRKHTKRIVALLLAVAMIFISMPVQSVNAADTYKLKCSGSKNEIIYTKESGWLYVTLLKNGKEDNLKKVKKSDIKWKSSDSSVVKIVSTEASYGVISAEVSGLKKGTATVTVSYKGASCKFKIEVRGGTIVPGYSDQKDAYVPAGYSLPIDIKGDGWDGLSSKDISFSSKDASVAKAVAYGDGYDYKIKGLKQGKTQISAKSKLGTLTINVTVLPRYDLQIKNYQNVKKNGKIVGISFDAVNKGTKPVTLIDFTLSEEWGDGGAVCPGDIKGGSVTVKKGQTKKVTIIFDSGCEYEYDIAKNGKLLDRCTAEIEMKYEGKILSAAYKAGKTKVDEWFYM